MNPIANVIGTNIVQASIQKNIDFKTLAKSIGTQEETLRKWISGDRQITVYGLVRISKALGVTMEQLTEGIK